jgi:wingless-type MMTV integration site family, member 5
VQLKLTSFNILFLIKQAVYRMVKVECRCHGVSGSCSMKTCWLKLPSFREIGDYLKEKYESAIEVKYESRHHQLKARYKRFSKPTKEDLIYIEDSPNYCNANPKLGSLGTQGRQCNKNSNGPDSCRIMCCGRGYYIQKTIKEEKCKCKFQWCCSVKCETCITEVETYICK